MFWLVIMTIISLCVSTVLLLGTYRTYVVQSAPGQKQFLKGSVPVHADGVYKGTVRNLKTSWIGKEFMHEKSSGINNFTEDGNVVKKYPFTTYVGKGIQDRNIQVLKIDYNIPENPVWLRFILDEVVQTDKHTLLGKLHIRILPGVAFTLGYFTLQQ